VLLFLLPGLLLFAGFGNGEIGFGEELAEGQVFIFLPYLVPAFIFPAFLLGLSLFF
jgi:hypothetical protein